MSPPLQGDDSIIVHNFVHPSLRSPRFVNDGYIEVAWLAALSYRFRFGYVHACGIFFLQRVAFQTGSLWMRAGRIFRGQIHWGRARNGRGWTMLLLTSFRLFSIRSDSRKHLDCQLNPDVGFLPAWWLIQDGLFSSAGEVLWSRQGAANIFIDRRVSIPSMSHNCIFSPWKMFLGPSITPQEYDDPELPPSARALGKLHAKGRRACVLQALFAYF